LRDGTDIATAQGAISFAISLYDTPMSCDMNGKWHPAAAARDTV
jgi:hypothetical protein